MWGWVGSALCARAYAQKSPSVSLAVASPPSVTALPPAAGACRMTTPPRPVRPVLSPFSAGVLEPRRDPVDGQLDAPEHLDTARVADGERPKLGEQPDLELGQRVDVRVSELD